MALRGNCPRALKSQHPWKPVRNAAVICLACARDKERYAPVQTDVRTARSARIASFTHVGLR